MAVVEIDVQKLKEGLSAYFATPEMKKLIDEIKTGGIRIGKLVTVFAIAVEAVKIVEKLADDLSLVGSGESKREAVVSWLDDLIKFNWIVEKIDGYLIGIAVDALVLYYNVKLGHTWLDVIKKFL